MLQQETAVLPATRPASVNAVLGNHDLLNTEAESCTDVPMPKIGRRASFIVHEVLLFLVISF